MHSYNRKIPGPCFTLLLTFSTTAIGGLPLTGQSAETTWEISAGQVASILGAASVALIPRIFSINDGLPTCAPCDPATLPAIDRWAVSTENTGWGNASWVGLLGLAAGTWYELNKQPNGNADVAASVEASAWTVGVNQVAKAVFNRNRPVLYSEDAIEVQRSVNSHRSMYSGHTAVSFALGTSYYLSMSDRTGFDRSWPLISAAVIGALRLAAGKHFPTDVLVGAILGIATSAVVHEIRF